MTMVSVTLEPCPFCGKRPRHNVGQPEVYCANPDCPAKPSVTWRSVSTWDKPVPFTKVAKAWNRRALI